MCQAVRWSAWFSDIVVILSLPVFGHQDDCRLQTFLDAVSTKDVVPLSSRGRQKNGNMQDASDTKDDPQSQVGETRTF